MFNPSSRKVAIMITGFRNARLKDCSFFCIKLHIFMSYELSTTFKMVLDTIMFLFLGISKMFLKQIKRCIMASTAKQNWKWRAANRDFIPGMGM